MHKGRGGEFLCNSPHSGCERQAGPIFCDRRNLEKAPRSPLFVNFQVPYFVQVTQLKRAVFQTGIPSISFSIRQLVKSPFEECLQPWSASRASSSGRPPSRSSQKQQLCARHPNLTKPSVTLFPTTPLLMRRTVTFTVESLTGPRTSRLISSMSPQKSAPFSPYHCFILRILLRNLLLQNIELRDTVSTPHPSLLGNPDSERSCRSTTQLFNQLSP